MIYISYDGETFVLQITILKKKFNYLTSLLQYLLQCRFSMQILSTQHSFNVHTITFQPSPFRK